MPAVLWPRTYALGGNMDNLIVFCPISRPLVYSASAFRNNRGQVLMPIFSFKYDDGPYVTNFYGDLDRAIQDLTERNEKAGRKVETEKTGANRARFTIHYQNVMRSVTGDVYCTMKTEKYPAPDIKAMEKEVMRLKRKKIPETQIVKIMGVSASLVRQIVRGLIEAKKLRPTKGGRTEIC
jgi:hypothetical protein